MTGNPVFNPAKLKKYVDENPDKTVKQIAKHFGAWYQAVYYRLNQMGYTYKKRLSLQKKRRKFLKELFQYNPEDMAKLNRMQKGWDQTFVAVLIFYGLINVTLGYLVLLY